MMKISQRLTLRQLGAFISAAELGNFTQVGRRLNLTASAISNQIAELEATLGFPVFERTTRKVVLTPEGREFLPMAIAIERQLEAAANLALDIKNRAIGVVRVAAPLTVAAEILPSLVASFVMVQPGVQVRIIDTGVEWLSDRVTNGEADLALGPDRLASPEVVAERLFPSPWVAWCAPSHPLARHESLPWSEALRWTLFLAGRDHEHSVLPLLPEPVAAAIKPAQIVENVTTALGLAATGLGFTCSPAYLGRLASLMGLVQCRLTEPDIIRAMTLYRPQDRRLSPWATAFADHIRGWSPDDTQRIIVEDPAAAAISRPDPPS